MFWTEMVSCSADLTLIYRWKVYVVSFNVSLHSQTNSSKTEEGREVESEFSQHAI